MLRSLQLPNVVLSSDAMARLADRPWPSLAHLDLSNNSLTRDAIGYVAAGNWLHLTALELGDNEMDAASVDALKAGRWNCLQSLNLQSCDLTLALVPELLKGQWPKLESLNLARNRCWAPSSFPGNEDDVAGVQTMTECWTALKRLDLTETGLVFVPEFALRAWSTLEDLKLTQNGMFGQVVYDVVAAYLPSLKNLSLQMTSPPWPGYKSDCMTSLAFANWPLLELLDLSGNCVNMQVLVHAHFPQLRFLHLAGVGFNAYYADVLSSGNWPELEVLDLDRNNMSVYQTCASMESLVRMRQWPLKVLSLRANQVTSRTLQMLLQQGWPTLQELICPFWDSGMCVQVTFQKILCSMVAFICGR